MDGGFGGNVGHDSHITSTHYALLILLGLGEIDKIDKDKIFKYINSLLKEDGSIMGDIGGEVDARFSYCAVSALDLLGGLNKWWDDNIIDKVCGFIEKCRNFDGGYGGLPVELLLLITIHLGHGISRCICFLLYWNIKDCKLNESSQCGSIGLMAQ